MFNKPTEIVEGLGNRLKMLRGGLNMSQDDFGKRIGKTGAQVSEMEREKSGLTIHTLSFLMKSFSVNPYWLFFGEGEQILSLENFTPHLNTPSDWEGLSNRVDRIEKVLKLPPLK